MAKTIENGTKFQVSNRGGGVQPMRPHSADNPDSREFKITLPIPPGRHEYKFVVNGAWYADPNSADCVPNAHGTLNSVPGGQDCLSASVPAVALRCRRKSDSLLLQVK